MWLCMTVAVFIRLILVDIKVCKMKNGIVILAHYQYSLLEYIQFPVLDRIWEK